MKKHKFNILPEMSGEEFDDLVRNIKTNGYDVLFPIIVYQGAILDGWNRYQAADKLGIAYTKEEFHGSEIEALQYVIRSNARRNLNSQQRATLAVESTELIRGVLEAIENERRFQQSQSLLNNIKLSSANLHNEPENTPNPTYEYDELVDNRPARTTTRKEVAKQFGVSDNYLGQAAALKKKDPEKFEQVKRGQTTFQQIKKEEKAKLSDIIAGNRHNAVTSLAKEFGYKIQTAIRNFELLIEDAQRSFTARGMQFADFAWDISILDLKKITTEAYLLKKYVKCPACNTQKCAHCKFGYVTEDTEKVIIDIETHKRSASNG